MSQNDPKQDPDFYNKVHLKDYKTLDAAVNIVKSLVSDVDKEYALHVDEDLVEPFYLNEHKRVMTLQTLKNALVRRIVKKIEIASMEEWYGIMLGSLDNKRYDQGLDSVKGQSRIFLTNNGEIKKFSHYGATIGPTGSQIQPPDLTQSHIRVKPNDWTSKATGEVREGWNGMFVENTEVIPISELKTRLFGHAIEVDDLAESQKYKSIVLRGRIGMVSPVDTWNETDVLVPDLKNGKEQYVKKEDGTFKTHPQTGVKIVKTKYKREKDARGQELKQCKYGTETTQWVFKVSLFNVDGESDNRVSVQFQQTKLGMAHILMQSANLVLEDAASLPMGGSEDPFNSLQNMWGGKEVVIVGTMISANSYQDSMWYGINGTLIMEEELVHTEPIVKKESTPVAEPEMKVIVAETAPVAEVTYDTIAPTTQPAPLSPPLVTPPSVVAPSPVTTTTTPVVTSDEEDAVLLDRAIRAALDSMGDDIDYDIVMSISVGMPEKFKDPLNELPVRKALDRIRKERIAANPVPTSEVAAPVADAPVTAASPPLKPSEKLTPEKLRAQIGASDQDEIEVISDPDDTKVPPGNIRCNCGVVMPIGEVEAHICKQQ